MKTLLKQIKWAVTIATGIGLLELLYLSKKLDFSWGFPSFAVTIVLTFIVCLQIYKLFKPKNMADFWHLLILAGFNILLASLLTVDASFLIALVLYMAAGLWALMLLCVQKNAHPKAAGLPSNEKMAHLPPLKVGGVVLVSWLITLGGGLLLFFIIPRMAYQIHNLQVIPLPTLTGFSENVAFGDIASIKSNKEPVFRATIMDLPFETVKKWNPYWRGMTLDRFVNEKWSVGSMGRRALSPDAGGLYFKNNQTESYDFVLDIVLEPLDSPILFGMDPFKGVRLLMNTQESSMAQNATGSFLYMGHHGTKMRYLAYSRFEQTTTPFYESIASQQFPYPLTEHYLQLPPLSPQVKNLALDVTQNKNSIYEKALALRDHLKKNYRYTLSRPEMKGSNSTEDFLFYNSEGHCEFFASSLVLLLRSIEIPARLVTGFIGGEWNEVGHYFLVRQADAHAWAEAFIPGLGWQRLDASPTYVPPASKKGIFKLFNDSLDAAIAKWNRWVIQYHVEDQLQFLNHVQTTLEQAKKSLAKMAQAISQGDGMKPRHSHFWMYLILLLLGLIFLWIAQKRKKTSPLCHSLKNISKKRLQISKHYLSFIRCLKKHGIQKEGFESSWELLHRLQAPRHMLQEIKGIIGLYEDLRFGIKIPGSYELKTFKNLIGKFKKTFRGTPNVEQSGIEPPASSLRTTRSPN